MEVILSPSILGANFCNLGKDIKELENSGIKTIHVDTMDGNFVPNITFGIDVIKAIRNITDMELDVHLMVMNPDIFIEDLVDAGVDSITVHAESCLHLYRTIYKIKSFGIKAGVALNPSTPPGAIKYVGQIVNKVLVMTVEPGFGGQKFIPCMLDKIKEVKELKLSQDMKYDIQVDGGINLDNVNEVLRAGANDIVIGSSIFNNASIDQNIKLINKVMNIK